MLNLKALLYKVLDRLNTLSTDYVVAQGTSGNWTYVKWVSGRFEAWYSASASTSCSTSTSNGWYRSSNYSITLPSIGQTAVGYAEVNVCVSDYAYVGANLTSITTTSLGYYVWHLATYSSVASTINAHIVGTWE